MRRKPASRGAHGPADGQKPRFAARADKPKFDKPRTDRPRDGKSAGERQRFEKRAAIDGARGERPHKKPRAERPEPAPRSSGFEGERIAKIMARAGVCSRRDAENWIAQGRVAVNGRVLTSPAVNVKAEDKITIDGAPMQERERTRLFLFHKPAGYVTTAHDPEGRATVFACLSGGHPELPRVVSVGRLDINTEGLLLLTNDGGLARTLELPATGWTRRYRVRVHGAIDQARLDALRGGVTIDGVRYAPIEARLEREQGANAWIAMSLTEGKNREIKRVMAHLGLDVTRLIRVSYGPFQLGDLAEGAVEEVRLKTLREQLGKSLAAFAGVDFSSPLRELTPAETQERRERADKRPRKHVSVLRSERDSKNATGPRARIERSATADRKGRAVAVERVSPTRRETEGAASTRNARRFEAMRGGEPPARREGARAAAGVSGEAQGRAERRYGAKADRRSYAANEPRRETVSRGAGHRETGASEARGGRSRDAQRHDARPHRPEKREKFSGPRDDRPRSKGGEGSTARNFERPRSKDSARPPRKGPPKGPRKGAPPPRGRR